MTMDYKKSKAPSTTVTRNTADLEDRAGNIYKAVVIAAKRSNQIRITSYNVCYTKLLRLPTPCTQCKCASQLRHTPI